MVKTKVLAMTSALLCSAVVSTASSAGGQIVGVIDSVAVQQQPAVVTNGKTPTTAVADPRRAVLTMTIRTDGGEARIVATDAHTQFIKVTVGSKQPGTQYTDARAALAGKCVDVDLRPDHEGVARVVRIRQKDVDPCDPCQAFR